MIAVGSDHAGFHLKSEILKYLLENGYEVKDFGVCDETSVDYPDYGQLVAEAIKDGICDKGIIVCGTGIGISISANKVPGIRAAVCSDTFSARMSKEHNDANILALGGRIVGVDLALDMIAAWLNANFLGERHKTRIDKISEIEKKYFK
jgi:ribose 5-phosphate isomerase B